MEETAAPPKPEIVDIGEDLGHATCRLVAVAGATFIVIVVLGIHLNHLHATSASSADRVWAADLSSHVVPPQLPNPTPIGIVLAARDAGPDLIDTLVLEPS